MPDGDVELVKEFQAGKKSVFNQLVLNHQKKIFNLIYRMIRNTEETQDLTQEVFLKAYHGLKDFKMESSFSTWLYRIAINSSINYTTGKRWKNWVSLFEVKEPEASWGNPLQDIRKDEINRAIDNAILSLPARQRSVFVLRYYEELPYQEIARMTGTSEGALKANYFQAVKKLQKKLAHLR